MSIRVIVANSLAAKAKEATKQIRWARPAKGVIKLNVDASYHVDEGAGATGAVLQDSAGAFIAASCSFRQYAMDVPSIKALALLEGLRLAEYLGIYALVVESDSQEIVQAMKDPSEYRASAAVLTDDCRQVLSSFGRATIVHCARESNGVAHWLARTSYRRKLNEVWQEHPLIS